MPDVQEVYEMVTKQKPPEPGALERQQKRQVRAARNKRVGAFLVAAAVGLVAIALLLAIRPGDTGTPTPADNTTTVNTADATSVEVVTNFLDAFGAYDAEKASAYLADGADMTGLTNGVEGPDGLTLMTSWLQATGNKMLLDPCTASTSATAGATYVTCPFDFHGLRSDEIGRGPFTGSVVTFTVRNGAIVSGSLNWDISKFSPQMWEPFANWVSTTYPKDAAVMYTDITQNDFRLTQESIRLWGERTREYAKEQATQGQ